MEPLERTFRRLTELDGPEPPSLIAESLDSPNGFVRNCLVRMLLTSNRISDHVQVLTRPELFDDELVRYVQQHSSQLAISFRQVLLQGTVKQAIQTLGVVRRTEQFTAGPDVVALLLRKTAAADVAIDTIRSLSWRMYDLKNNAEESRAAPEQAAAAISCGERFLTAVVNAISSGIPESWQEILLEAAMLVGGPGHADVRRLTWSTQPGLRECTARLFMRHTHPGILCCLVDSLSYNYPHPRVLDAIRRRVDVEFITYLLRLLDRKPSSRLLFNLAQIEHIDWLESGLVDLSFLSEQEQVNVLTMLEHTRLPKTVRKEVEEWVLRHGHPAARAAAGRDGHLDAPLVQELVLEGLSSTDSAIEAWACRELRSQHVPGALRLLIGRLDSTADEVVNAARDSLFELFNATRMLDLFGSMNQEVGPIAGKLLLQVDLKARETLEAELTHSVPQRRLRAVECCRRLKLHRVMEPMLLQRIHDSEAIVRRALIDVFEEMPGPATIEALQVLMRDESPRVKLAAIAALRSLPPLESALLRAEEAAPSANAFAGAARGDASR